MFALKKEYFAVVATMFFTAVFALGQNDFEALVRQAQQNPSGEALDGILAITYEQSTANPDAATDAFTAGRNIARESGDALREAHFNDKLGLVHYLAGRYDSSTHYNLLAIQQFEQLNLPLQAARLECSLGHQMKRRNLDEAFEHFRKGISTMEKANDRHELGSQYNNFGVLFEMRGDLDSAYHFYSLSLEIKEEFKDSLGIPFSLNNMATCLMLQNDTSGVFALIQKAYNIRKARKDDYGIAENKTLFGEYFIKKGDGLTAIRWLNQSISKCDSLNLPFQNQFNYEKLAVAHVLLGDYRSALLATGRAHTIKDSLFNESNAKTIFELEKRFDLAGKEKANAELREQNTRQRLMVLSLLLLAMIIALGAIIIIQKSRRDARQEKDALIIREREAGLAAVIEATEAERRRLAKELHDGVGQQLSGLKLAMSQLASKLSVQMPEEETALRNITSVLDETAADVRTISHSMMPRALQETGLVPAIDDMLRKSLGLTGTDYRFEHFQVENLRFEAKLEVGLYRICQELINNIIKHANARFVSVQLFATGGQLILIVEDNGRGFDPEGKKDGIGLMNIASRLNTIKGEVNYEPGPESGTVATVRILI